MIWAITFSVVAVLLCCGGVLALLAITHLSISGTEGIERDGLARGKPAPAWSLMDSAGTLHRSPPDKPLQLIMFSDHSLKSFPSVIEGLRELHCQSDELETVIVMRGQSKITEPVLHLLGLDDIPVLTGSSSLYGKYNVRVTPYVIFVDSSGQVRASSLVNHAWQLVKLLQIAALPIEPNKLPTTASRMRAATPSGM